MKKIEDLFFDKKKHCPDKSLDEESPDGIGVSIIRQIKDKNEFEELVTENRKSNAERVKLSKEMFLKNEIGSITNEIVGKDFYKLFWLQSLSNIKNKFRWQFELICLRYHFQLTGGYIVNPSSETLSDLKANRFNIAEPYKTIFDSVKCIEPKIKK